MILLKLKQEWKFSSPISGTASEVGGMASATMSKNTQSDMKIVIPVEIIVVKIRIRRY